MIFNKKKKPKLVKEADVDVLVIHSDGDRGVDTLGRHLARSRAWGSFCGLRGCGVGWLTWTPSSFLRDLGVNGLTRAPPTALWLQRRFIVVHSVRYACDIVDRGLVPVFFRIFFSLRRTDNGRKAGVKASGDRLNVVFRYQEEFSYKICQYPRW